MTFRESLGHYEILSPIGAGGMGEVYVARDPKLGRRVAIKLLPQRLASDRDTLSRFTQEARSASALNHPNIVTIHEVGAHEGTPYIVMEYVEGHDLRSLIADGPLTIRKVLDIAVQIADGLAAAHERGIVHRDLKPENIMITRDGYVKILDFGLAKIVSPSSESQENTLQLDLPGTTPGTILGTVGYMSPEQASGKRLDFRSDQFAFGAILYELATGRAAFEGETAIDTLSAILHKDPAPITKSVPRAPAQLADIIRRLLEKSTDDRYSSARDLAREIRLVRDRIAAEESGYHQSQPSIEVPKKTTVAVVAAIALAVFIAGAVFMARDRGATTATDTSAPAPVARKLLAIMRFQDLTGDPNGRLVVDGFAETLAARMAHYPNVQVVRPNPADPEESDPRKVARNLGANLVLSGSMMRDSDRIRVTYTAIDTANGRDWRGIVDGNVSSLFSVQDDLAERVARDLSFGESVVRVALDPAVSQQKYLEAIGYLRRNDDGKSVDEAVQILEELGDSPSVQAALARAYLYRFRDTKNAQWANSAAKAAERAVQGDPQSIDVHITLGELHRDTGRYAESIAAFTRVLSQQPTHADAVVGLAATYQASGDHPNAEASYKRAIALQPSYWSPYNHLGAFYYRRGRYDDARAQFEKVVQLLPASEQAYNNLGAVLQRLGRYEDSLRVFQQSVERNPTSQGYSNLGTTYYFLGRFTDAAAAFTRATEISRHDYLYWRNLGDAYRWIPGKDAEARNAHERAVALCDQAIAVSAANDAAHASRATSLAKLGRAREARAAILRALELAPRDSSFCYEAAIIANIAGDEEEALARIEQAIRLNHPPGDALRDPEFANLRKSGSLQVAIQGPGSTK